MNIGRCLIGVLVLSSLSATVVYGESSDKSMFDVMLKYSSEQNAFGGVEIVSEGVSIEDSIMSKVVKPSTSNVGSGSNQNDVPIVKPQNPNKPVVKPPVVSGGNKDKFFVGTKDFSNFDVSKKDANQYNWSAIRPEYSKFDDGKEDNVTIIATAYTSAAEENGGYEGMNAIGGRLGPGCIATPKDIPFQTKIRISGLGVFNTEDRGSAIVRVDENTIRIDVWMDSYKEAIKFGKRVYKGRILT